MNQFVRYFTRKLRLVKSFLRRGNYATALRGVCALLRDKRMAASSYLLLQRSILMQLVDLPGDGKQNLENIEASLRDAVALDPSSVEAREELGWFLCNVQNKVKEARHIFTEVIRLCQDYLESALLGYAECTYDIDGPRAALLAIREVAKQFPHSGRVREKRLSYARAARYAERQKGHKTRKKEEFPPAKSYRASPTRTTR